MMEAMLHTACCICKYADNKGGGGKDILIITIGHSFKDVDAWLAVFKSILHSMA